VYLCQINGKKNIETGFLCWEFGQSGFFDVGLSANQILLCWDSSQSAAFNLTLSTHQIL
jgi:hypothetical protein